MNNKLITGVLVAAIVGIGAVAVFANKSTPHSEGGNQQANKSTEAPAEVMEANAVVYSNFKVLPEAIKVKKGTTVTWTNEDVAKHDVTPDEETAEFKSSKLFGKGESHSVTFNTPGTYTYHCSPHPYMKGTVEVVE